MDKKLKALKNELAETKAKLAGCDTIASTSTNRANEILRTVLRARVTYLNTLISELDKS